MVTLSIKANAGKVGNLRETVYNVSPFCVRNPCKDMFRTKAISILISMQVPWHFQKVHYNVIPEHAVAMRDHMFNRSAGCCARVSITLRWDIPVVLNQNYKMAKSTIKTQLYLLAMSGWIT